MQEPQLEQSYFMRAVFGRREEIYNMLEPLMNNIAQEFKLAHEDECKYISTMELDIYVSMGLMKAVQQFTPSVESSVFSVFATYCIYNELHSGIRLLQGIQSPTYINEWETQNYYIQKTNLTQYNYIHETTGEQHNENDIISLFTYIKLWEYIDILHPILRRAFTRRYSDIDFNQKHLYNGVVII
jgi:DNA-directed RNA polymerase specialized sigma subunit